MTSRTRMFKTVCVLAASMVAGSFVLAGIKPDVLRSLTQSPILLHARGQGATEGEAGAAQRWEAVRVVCAAAGDSAPVPAHVVIDESGSPAVNPTWRDLRCQSGSVACLVIRLDVAP